MLTSVSFNTDGWTLCLELAANSPIRIKPKNAARNAAVNVRDSNTEVHISGKAWTIRANIGREIGRRVSIWCYLGDNWCWKADTLCWFL